MESTEEEEGAGYYAGKVWFEGSITKSDAKSDSNNGEAPEKSERTSYDDRDI